MKLSRALFAAMIALAFIACETTPEEPIAAVLDPAVVPERAEAISRRNVILEYELAETSPDSFARGEELFHQAEERYAVGDEEAGGLYGQAIPFYDTVIATGFAERIRVEKAEIAEVRSRAEEARAPVAARESFEGGVERYRSAEAAEQTADFERAYLTYRESKVLFQASYDQAVERRRRAQAALDSADRQLGETEERVRGLERDLAEELEDEE